MTTARRASPRPRTVLTAIARTAARLCEAGDALIFQVEEERLRLVARAGREDILDQSEGIRHDRAATTLLRRNAVRNRRARL